MQLFLRRFFYFTEINFLLIFFVTVQDFFEHLLISFSVNHLWKGGETYFRDGFNCNFGVCSKMRLNIDPIDFLSLFRKQLSNNISFAVSETNDHLWKWRNWHYLVFITLLYYLNLRRPSFIISKWWIRIYNKFYSITTSFGYRIKSRNNNCKHNDHKK